jgi:cytochrome c-type biogenesis protein CcmF
MWWSYEVLGWGGYWAWDPVENASFMPWLTATAFMHSAMVQERRGLLRVWNMSLIISDVPAHDPGHVPDPQRRHLVRARLQRRPHRDVLPGLHRGRARVLAGAAGGPVDGAAQRRAPGHMVSRETVFLVNNLLLTAFTFTVLLGTMFPLLAEALRGVKVSVGAPFFNR